MRYHLLIHRFQQPGGEHLGSDPPGCWNLHRFFSRSCSWLLALRSYSSSWQGLAITLWKSG